MELIKPELGLIFWMTLSFLAILFILRKFAWKPILNMLSEREQTIEGALSAAKKARDEVANMKSENERLLNEARAERDKLMREARDTRDQIVAEARNKAQVEANKLLTQAREAIQTEKSAAIAELKNQVASMSLEIAEKILRQELTSFDKQKMVMENLVKDINLN